MSNLSQHLFQVIDDVPRYCPIQLNIPCFKELYIKDVTPDKSEYSKQLAFIWFYLDANSPYFNSAERMDECLIAAFGTTKYKITKSLQECMDEYVKRQSTAELRSLSAITNILDGMIKDLNRQKESGNEQMEEYISDIHAQMKMEKDLTQRFVLAEMRDKALSSINKNNTDVVNLIPKISNTIKEMVELRKVVAKSLVEIDSTSNKENIANHIIYDIIDTNRGY
jgi:hypothetical protein